MIQQAEGIIVDAESSPFSSRSSVERRPGDAGSHAKGPVIPTQHASGVGLNGPVAIRLSRRPAGQRQQENHQRPADAREPDNNGPGPAAARTPKREIGCTARRTRVRGTGRGSGVVGLVTHRDSASLRRTADGSRRHLSKLGAPPCHTPSTGFVAQPPKGKFLSPITSGKRRGGIRESGTVPSKTICACLSPLCLARRASMPRGSSTT